MNSRERVVTALDHRKPDRIPRYEVFFQSFIDRWRLEKGLSPEADIRAYYGIDIPFILGNQQGPFWRQSSEEETGGDVYYIRDSWGRFRKHLHSAAFFDVLETAVKEKSDIDKPEFLDLAEQADSGRMCVDEEFNRKLHDPRFTPVTGVMGLYMACSWLRGESHFLVDMAEDADFCRGLAERISRFLTVMGEQMLVLTGAWDTAIWVYDDFSTNTGPLISPAMFEKYFLDSYRKMFDYWKSKGARHIILHHDIMSENSYPIVDLFLEAGLTGVQGVYPTAGLTLPAFKARYGRKLSIVGGMCNTHVLPFGTKQEIERDVRAILEVASEGGVIIGSHSIEGYIPVENYDYYCSVLGQQVET